MPQRTRSAATAANGRPKRLRARPGEESARRAEIVATAGGVFAARGFANATVREIADEVGILSGSLYHHFRSKEDMVDEILSTFFRKLLEGYRSISATASDPLGALADMIRLAFGTIKTDQTAMTILHNDAGFLGQFDRFRYLWTSEDEVRQLWTSAIHAAKEAGLLRPDVDADLLYLFARESVWGAVSWYRPKGSRSIGDVADEFVRIYFGGAATAAGMRKLR